MHTDQTLQNSHIRLETNAVGIIALHGRFTATDEFSPNLLSSRTGIGWGVLERPFPEMLGASQGEFRLGQVTRTDTSVHWTTDWFADGDETVLFSVEWQIDLPEQARAARVTSILTLRRAIKLKALTFSVMTPQWFLAGLFERGVVQQIKHGESVFASSDPLNVFYTVGHDQGSVAVMPLARAAQSLLCRDAARDQTGVQFVLAGRFPLENAWQTNDWSEAAEHQLEAGESFTVSFDLYANDLPFPTHTVEAASLPSLEDVRTQFTSVYAVQVGCLGSYAIPGSAYPTILMPDRHYRAMHTFFDPDAWSLVNTLAFSGDSYLVRQARAVLERALGSMTGTGQLPHHFDAQTPVYVAISGAAQTGPNIFWCMAAIDYVCATGDTAWLRHHWMAGLLRAAAWVLEHFDPERKLLRVSGPLWIDVFKRDGYAFDTNAMAVRLFTQMAGAAALLGQMGVSERFRAVATEITQGLEALWDGVDHYVTSRGTNWQDVRDMVDSDNYAAIAFGVTKDPTRIAAIFARLDGAPHTHPGGRGTWVSERFYNVDDCYLGNVGDSACAMARLFWVDMRARHAVGDAVSFKEYFGNVRQDFFDMTWMRERYDAQGKMIRAPGYHEYPGVLSMLLREGWYGLEIGLEEVVLTPLTTEPFEYRLGHVRVAHSKSSVEITVPGEGMRDYRVGGLEPLGSYQQSGGATLTADAMGCVRFQAAAGAPQTLDRLPKANTSEQP